MSIQRCQDETSSTQFLDWLEYLRLDVNAFHREDYYWAQIAQEIRRTAVKDPKNVKIEQFLQRFETKKKKPKMSGKERAMRFKRNILARFGIKG